MKLFDLLDLVPDFVPVRLFDFNYGSPHEICSFLSKDLYDFSWTDISDSSVISLSPACSSLEIYLLL